MGVFYVVPFVAVADDQLVMNLTPSGVPRNDVSCFGFYGDRDSDLDLWGGDYCICIACHRLMHSSLLLF
jgi:hypothetical protein